MKKPGNTGFCSSLVWGLGITGLFILPQLSIAEPTTKAEFDQIDEGFRLFTEETFEGNGRVCATCHIPKSGYTIGLKDIHTASHKDRKLIFATNTPGLENRTLIKKLGLFNIGPDDATVDNPHGPFRSSMAVQSVDTTTLNNFLAFPAPPEIPAPIMLGWSGNGSPNDGFHHGNNDPDADGTIRAFANGAIAQHNPKTLTRISKETACPGAGGPDDYCNKHYDFRFATDEELDAMAAFQNWLGRRVVENPPVIGENPPIPVYRSGYQEFDLASLKFKDHRVEHGKQLFMSPQATCNVCHSNGGGHFQLELITQLPPGAPPIDFTALPSPPVVGTNILQDTGTAAELDKLSALTGINIPIDEDTIEGLAPDLFNVQSIIEAPRKDVFFHNSAVSALTVSEDGHYKKLRLATVEDATEFYFRPPFARTFDEQGNVIAPGAPQREAMEIIPFVAGKRTETLDDFLEFAGPDGIERLGAFQRSLFAYYAIRDCERLVDEMITRIEVGASPLLAAKHCGFALKDVQEVLGEAQLKRPIYKRVSKRAGKLGYQIKYAAYHGKIRKLEKILVRLGKLREKIATIEETSTLAAN